MADTKSRQIYVNLAVRDLPRAMNFFTSLGFEFNPHFTDENAACMIVNGDAYVMLLVEPFFKTFTNKEVCDTSKHTEGMFALSCESRAEVDQTVQKAIDAGGSQAHDAQDHGFMYSSSFYDLDGHHWEVMWMDPATVPA